MSVKIISFFAVVLLFAFAMSFASPWRLGVIQVKSIHTAHDFITTSRLRNNLFEEHLTQAKYLNIAPIINRVTDSLSLGGFHLKALKLGYTLQFSDGSTITVQPDLGTSTLRIVSGTAKDADNNIIPT